MKTPSEPGVPGSVVLDGSDSGPTFALYGGSFDPPHIAHTLVAAWAKATADVDRVLVVPTFKHAFGKRSVAFEHRAAMCRIAMSDLKSAEVSSIELELEKSLTYETLRALSERHPQARFRLLIGSDILGGAHRWHRWPDVAEMAPPLVIGREGYPTDTDTPVTLPSISSTDIRGRLARGASTEGLLSPSVAAYIAEHALYRGGDDD